MVLKKIRDQALEYSVSNNIFLCWCGSACGRPPAPHSNTETPPSGPGEAPCTLQTVSFGFLWTPENCNLPVCATVNDMESSPRLLSIKCKT